MGIFNADAGGSGFFCARARCKFILGWDIDKGMQLDVFVLKVGLDVG